MQLTWWLILQRSHMFTHSVLRCAKKNTVPLFYKMARISLH